MAGCFVIFLRFYCATSPLPIVCYVSFVISQAGVFDNFFSLADFYFRVTMNEINDDPEYRSCKTH